MNYQPTLQASEGNHVPIQTVYHHNSKHNTPSMINNCKFSTENCSLNIKFIELYVARLHQVQNHTTTTLHLCLTDQFSQL